MYISAPNGYLATSTGSVPSPEINPVVIQTIKELSIDTANKNIN